MSMLSHQIEQLKDLRFRMGTSDKHNSTDWTLIDGAIDTIESLSAKLAKTNMERSERYYNGGWIACKDRLPTKEECGNYGKEFNATVAMGSELKNSDTII